VYAQAEEHEDASGSKAEVVSTSTATPDTVATPSASSQGAQASDSTLGDDVKELTLKIAANQYGSVQPHDFVSGELNMFDVNLFESSEPQRGENLRGYYSLCRDSPCLVVTMSNFAIWNKHGKTNGFAKVIPAIRRVPDSENTKVFFFDDNLDMEGFEQSPGICNLRDVNTGEFVNFASRHNGFVGEHVASHTSLAYSSEYNNVLVQANILDAMEDHEYFLKIIRRYASPGDKVVVYMDINSAIVCADSVSGKGTADIVLSTMFELIDIKPHEEGEFVWESRAPVKLKGEMSLKALAKKLAGDDKEYYRSFYSLDRCCELVAELVSLGTLRWRSEDRSVTVESFKESFDRYFAVVSSQSLEAGIAQSWFDCYQAMRDSGHVAVLNSFGIDTKTVVEKTVADVSEVLQLTVNFGLWDARDAKKFKSQYGSTSKGPEELIN
jgi:hypothetical protein